MMLRQKLMRDGHAFGAMVFEFLVPGIAQLSKNAGAEFVLYDMEHSGIGIESIKAQCAYCRPRSSGYSPHCKVWNAMGLLPLVIQKMADQKSRTELLRQALDLLVSDGYLVKQGDVVRFRSSLLRRYWMELQA